LRRGPATGFKPARGGKPWQTTKIIVPEVRLPAGKNEVHHRGQGEQVISGDDAFHGKLIIQLAPTGMVPKKSDTPHVPITPEEIARDTYEAYRLGASAVHLHARDAQGNPTYTRDVYSRIFSLVREKCPGIVICASTSGRADRDLGHRSEVLELKPDMASLTLGSVNFLRQPSINTLEDISALARRMDECGVKPELEIFEPGFIGVAEDLLARGLLRRPLHFNLLLGSRGSVPAEMRDLVYLAESLPADSTWAAAGIGRYQSRINTAAILMGGHVRVGLEDALHYDPGRQVLATNGQLVRRIVTIAGELGREIATPAEAREILGLAKGCR
jgi:3-keto-5-aminohexanoate cleavage enzyme